MRLLLVSEEPSRLARLSEGLSRWGFSCLVAKGEEAPGLLQERGFAVMLLEEDSLPWESLEHICQAARTRRIPLIVLLAAERVEAFELEADDFFVLSGKVDELALRARRLGEKNSLSNEVLRLGDVTIDPSRYEVTVGGKSVSLTYREYELLRFLAENPGRVFKRETLLDRVWGFDYFGGDRTVDVHIRRLRSKLEYSNSVSIETLRNIGYRLTLIR